MSVTFFSRQSGTVAAFLDPTLPATATLAIDDWGGFSQFKSIITRVVVAAQGNFQFLHTLGGNIYVYVFGDKIGNMQLSGLAFEASCSGSNSIGIESVLNYYSANRLAARQVPINVTIGANTTLQAYLVAIQADVADPASRTYQFSMNLVLIPTSQIPCSKTKTKTKDDSAGGKDDGEAKKTIIAIGGGVGTTGSLSSSSANYPSQSSDSISMDGSFPSDQTTAVVASGYAAVGTGPNTAMVKGYR